MGPARQQGKYGFCGSFTAADQIGQRLGFGGRISALHVALNAYNVLAEGNKYPLLNSAKVQRDLSKIYGQTPAQVFDRGLKNLSKSEVSEFGGEHPDIVARAYNLAGSVCLDDHITKNYDDMGNLIQRLENNLLRNLSSGDPNYCSESNESLKKKKELVVSPELFFKLMNITLNESCRTSVPLPKISIEPVIFPCWQMDKAGCFQGLNEGLNNGRIVGITYRTDSFTKEPSNDGKDVHASSIVSRKWNKVKKTCEYEIRNSWGPECENSYKEDSSISCNEGYVWVTDDLLQKMVQQVNYLK